MGLDTKSDRERKGERMTYTKEELEAFRHGLSCTLCSLKSAQYWKHEEKTAKDIDFLEMLYTKVEKDISGKEKE